MTDDGERGEVRSSPWRELGMQWAHFCAVALSPDVLVLGVATVALVLLGINLAPSVESASTVGHVLNAILTIMIAIASGLVGARVAHRLEQLSGRGILVTRGKSAIRGLRLLHLNVRSLEDRTRALGTRVGSAPDLAIQSFEEIAGRCDTLEEEVLNAIEEWQDIIPEANLSTQIGAISELKAKQLQLIQDADALRKELSETKDQSAQDKTKLNTALAEKEKQLQKVSQELRWKEVKLGTSVGSVGGIGSSYTNILGGGTKSIGGISISNITGVTKCDACGKERLSMLGYDTCPHCFGLTK